jgi:UDP-N-acetylmuramoyl-tripeptide--D-alanyl-D-alanine ligase
VVLNADNPRVAAMATLASAPVVTFGRERPADVTVGGAVAEDAAGLAFPLRVGSREQAVRLAFAGTHNVVNALAAAAAAHALGLGLPEIARGLAAARPVRGRCVWRQAGGVRILDDTYNANPASARAAIETLRAARGDGRLVVALGDMLELGDLAVEAHREVGRAIADAGVAEFVGVGRLAGEAVEAARERGLTEVRHTMAFEDTVACLLKRLAPGDLLLVKGSRGVRMERVVDALIARLGKE